MKVLVTGSKGYIGSVLVEVLLERGDEVVGLDVGYFETCLLDDHTETFSFLRRDIRDVTRDDVEGFDAIIHLAALSNDPLGELAPNLTEDINLGGTIRLAELAKQAGVERFIYASSQSMYGIADDGDILDEYNSEKRPLTSYARTKWDAEVALMKLHSSSFQVVCFRPSTVFGASPRLRCDIVFNNFVGCAYTTKKIEVKSDGTPWRPLIHIFDMARAVDWAVSRKYQNTGNFLTINTGSDQWNYQVKELAHAVALEIPGTEVKINSNAQPDNRSYKVDFSKFKEVAPDHQPVTSLAQTVKGLKDGLTEMGFVDKDFHNSDFIRLNVLKNHISNNRLNKNLNWINR